MEPESCSVSILSRGLSAKASLLAGFVEGAGAVPATVCVLDGVAHVGTADGDLARLAELGLKMRKAGTRDLPLLMSGIGGKDRFLLQRGPAGDGILCQRERTPTQFAV